MNQNTDDEVESDRTAEQSKEKEEVFFETRQESMPFSLHENVEEEKEDTSDDLRGAACSSQQRREDGSVNLEADPVPASSNINIHGSHNFVVVVQGTGNIMDIQDALAAQHSKRHVGGGDKDGTTSGHGDDRIGTEDTGRAGSTSEEPLLTLQTKVAAGGKFQLGDDLAMIASQETTPTPDSPPEEPFGSPSRAYSQVSTVYSPTHTTDSNWSGSDSAARLAVIDEEDVPSPKSSDDWMSTSSDLSTLASSGDSRYSPTTPVHSDWMSGPSSPDSENPPDSPGEAETPWEIMVRGDQAVEAYLRASRNGTKKVYRTRVMLVGQERVGKTSLLKSLIGKEHDNKEEITDGVDTTTVCRFPLKDCTSPWEVQHTDKTDRVQHAHAQYNKAVGSSMAQELLEMSQDGEDFQSTPENKQKVESQVVLGSTVNQLEEYSDQEDEHGDAANDKMSQSPSKVIVPQEITEEALQELQHQSDDKKKQEADRVLQFQFWDFAGQDIYYTTHQVFLNRRAIFVLVYDASQDLQSPSKVEAAFGHEQEKSRYHDFTGVDFIHFWLQSIYAYAVHTPKRNDGGKQPQFTPPVFVVGTHRDSITPQGGCKGMSMERQHQQIYETIEEKPYEKHVIRRFHMVENSSEDKRDPQLMDLRRHLAEVASKESYMGEKIPLRWLRFEKAILEAVANNKTHMHIRKVRELARSFKIKEYREFSTMLQFYHDLGCIVYFGGDKRGKHNQALRDVVILDPQWLIDVFKRIITVKQNSKQWSTYCNQWRRLRDTGILEEELMDHVWQDLQGLKPTFISLMEMFDLLCPQCIPAEGSKCAKEKKIYYVPACLQPSCQKTPADSNWDNTDGTFYVDFEEFLPDGLFHRVLVHIARWSQEENKMPPKLYYRHGVFYVGAKKALHIVELHMKPSKPACIKVTVKRPTVLRQTQKRDAEACHPCPQTCSQVQRKLESILNIVRQTWIYGIAFEFRVACEACNSPDIPAGDMGLHLLCFYECTHADIDEVFCSKSGCSVPTEIYKKRFKHADTSAKRKCDQRNGNRNTNPNSTSSDSADNQSNSSKDKNGNVDNSSLSTTQEIDNNQNTTGNVVTDRQLSILAGKMGAEWKAFGVEQLDMSKEDIDHCILSDPQGTVQNHIFAMLHKWKCKSSEGATVTVLVEKLRTFGVNRECYDCLLPTQ